MYGKGLYMKDKKKRGVYVVESYDGTIRKIYANYRSAYNYANKLARAGKWNRLLECTGNEFVELAAC